MFIDLSLVYGACLGVIFGPALLEALFGFLGDLPRMLTTELRQSLPTLRQFVSGLFTAAGVYAFGALAHHLSTYWRA